MPALYLSYSAQSWGPICRTAMTIAAARPAVPPPSSPCKHAAGKDDVSLPVAPPAAGRSPCPARLPRGPPQPTLDRQVALLTVETQACAARFQTGNRHLMLAVPRLFDVFPPTVVALILKRDCNLYQLFSVFYLVIF